VIKKLLLLMIEKLSKDIEHLDKSIKSLKYRSNLENYYIDIGKQLFDVASNYPITEEDLLKNCETIAEFTSITTIRDIEKYLFINRREGIVRRNYGRE